VVPSVEIYNVLLKAYLALDPEKSHQELKSVIAEMQEYRLKPDAITYTLWMATAARGIASKYRPPPRRRTVCTDSVLMVIHQTIRRRRSTWPPRSRCGTR
jgi:hypothetical protein